MLDSWEYLTYSYINAWFLTLDFWFWKLNDTPIWVLIILRSLLENFNKRLSPLCGALLFVIHSSIVLFLYKWCWQFNGYLTPDLTDFSTNLQSTTFLHSWECCEIIMSYMFMQIYKKYLFLKNKEHV